MYEKEQLQQIEDMFGEEELHEDLKPWVFETELGPALQHPYLFMLFFNPHMHKIANTSYRHKKKYIEGAEKDKNFSAVISMYERAYRWEAFGKYCEHFSDEEYWNLLGFVWIDSENIYQHFWEAHKYMTSDRPGRWQHMMEESERESFEKLPQELTIYRGWCYEESAQGLSWTLDENTAHWFASRFAAGFKQDPFVTKAIVDKNSVLAYFLGRNENEIVIDPDDLSVRYIDQYPAENRKRA